MSPAAVDDGRQQPDAVVSFGSSRIGRQTGLPAGLISRSYLGGYDHIFAQTMRIRQNDTVLDENLEFFNRVCTQWREQLKARNP